MDKSELKERLKRVAPNPQEESWDLGKLVQETPEFWAAWFDARIRLNDPWVDCDYEEEGTVAFTFCSLAHKLEQTTVTAKPTMKEGVVKLFNELEDPFEEDRDILIEMINLAGLLDVRSVVDNLVGWSINIFSFDCVETEEDAEYLNSRIQNVIVSILFHTGGVN